MAKSKLCLLLVVSLLAGSAGADARRGNGDQNRATQQSVFDQIWLDRGYVRAPHGGYVPIARPPAPLRPRR
jgi:hypothetical protein